MQLLLKRKLHFPKTMVPAKAVETTSQVKKATGHSPVGELPANFGNPVKQGGAGEFWIVTAIAY